MYKVQKHGCQSPWLEGIYNKYIPYKTDGFLVEFGVGHTLELYRHGGRDKWKGAEDLRCGSNTAGLMDIGWSGIYVEPIKDFCDELKISLKDSLDRLTVVNKGASDKAETSTIYAGETFIPNNFKDTGYYEPDYIGDTIETDISSKILS